MIKTILVPATGSDMDIAVFRSALTVAGAFAAHLEVLHVHADATPMPRQSPRRWLQTQEVAPRSSDWSIR